MSSIRRENRLLADIVEANGGVVTNKDNRCKLLIDWLDTYQGPYTYALAKIISFGDSFTHIGATYRSAEGSYRLKSVGYWVWADQLATSDYYLLDHAGVSGNTTEDMLARMNDVLLSGADIVNILAGTNDIGEGRTPAQIKVSMQSIVDQIIANGQKALLNQVAHRYDTVDPAATNAIIDALNVEYKDIASGTNGCAICSDLTEFNSYIDAGNWVAVSSDKLHPNSVGASMIGAINATGLDTYYPSTAPEFINEQPNPDLSGNSGIVQYGATGELFDDWVLQYADPTDGGAVPGAGVGATLIDVNGSNGVRLKTGTIYGSSSQAFLRCDNKPVDANNTYVLDAIVSTNSTSDFVTLSFDLLTSSSSAGTASYSLNIPAGDIAIDGARISTPPIDVLDSSTVSIRIKGYSGDGTSVEWEISNIRLYKI